MATGQQSPFEHARSALCKGLRMAMLGHDQRHAANLIESRRIGRDRRTVEHMHAAIAQATSWQGIADAYQAIMTEYLTTTSELWQDEIALVARGQSEFGTLFRETLDEWGTAWTDAWTGLPSMIAPAGKPLDTTGWFKVFDRSLEPAEKHPESAASVAGHAADVVPARPLPKTNSWAHNPHTR